MDIPRYQPIRDVIYAELLFNRNRVAPYILFALFAANALFWQLGGPARQFGWAVNSEFFIVRQFLGFSFLTLPFFTAMMMGDPVVRDFRLGIVPLIHSKPITRGEYALGKFCGNFLVLVCCQAAFALAMMVGQSIRPSGMLFGPVQLLPYFKHFLFFVVLSHLALGAFCFAIGTLTRNVKLVYGLVTALLPAYIAWQLILSNLPSFWRTVLDPLLLNWSGGTGRGQSAAYLNQLVVTYDAGMILNRVSMLLIVVFLLLLVYRRFSRAETEDAQTGEPSGSLFGLGTKFERLSIEDARDNSGIFAQRESLVVPKPVIAIPPVHLISHTWSARIKQFAAATEVEFRLLLAERSLIVLFPLLLFFGSLELFYLRPADASPSFDYAENAVKNLFILLFGLTVFYTGETLHRDRDVKIEPLLWSTPAPNWALILSKLSAILLLELVLVAVIAPLALIAQIGRGHRPVEISIYLITYSLILLPGLLFMTAATVSLNLLLRDKYLGYAVCLAIGGTLLYLFSQGHTHWLYNPLLVQLYDRHDLALSSDSFGRILLYRAYWLAVTIFGLSLAHLSFTRKS